MFGWLSLQATYYFNVAGKKLGELLSFADYKLSIIRFVLVLALHGTVLIRLESQNLSNKKLCCQSAWHDVG